MKTFLAGCRFRENGLKALRRVTTFTRRDRVENLVFSRAARRNACYTGCRDAPTVCVLFRRRYRVARRCGRDARVFDTDGRAGRVHVDRVETVVGWGFFFFQSTRSWITKETFTGHAKINGTSGVRVLDALIRFTPGGHDVFGAPLDFILRENPIKSFYSVSNRRRQRTTVFYFVRRLLVSD